MNLNCQRKKYFPIFYQRKKFIGGGGIRFHARSKSWLFAASDLYHSAIAAVFVCLWHKDGFLCTRTVLGSPEAGLVNMRLTAGLLCFESQFSVELYLHRRKKESQLVLLIVASSLTQATNISNLKLSDLATNSYIRSPIDDGCGAPSTIFEIGRILVQKGNASMWINYLYGKETKSANITHRHWILMQMSVQCIHFQYGPRTS